MTGRCGGSGDGGAAVARGTVVPGGCTAIDDGGAPGGSGAGGDSGVSGVSGVSGDSEDTGKSSFRGGTLGRGLGEAERRNLREPSPPA